MSEDEEKPLRIFCTWCRGTGIYHNKPCSECKDGVQEFEYQKQIEKENKNVE